MKDRKTGAVYLFLFLCLAPLIGAQDRLFDERIVLGDDDGWSGLIRAEHVALIEGHRGSADIVLRDNEYVLDNETEMLLRFNDPSFDDEVGNYLFDNGSTRITSMFAKMGSGSAVVQAEDDGLVYRAEPGALFYPGTPWSSFSMEFWVYAATLSEGETLFEWNGSRIDSERPRPQEVHISVVERRLVWRFENFFVPPDREGFIVQVAGRDSLIPRMWSHHLLRYDGDTGKLEYLVNGVPQDIAYATSTGRESGSVYVPFVGSASGLTMRIAPRFAGFLDEFRIYRGVVDEPRLDRIGTRRGLVVTGVMDLSFVASRLHRIDATFSRPGNTDILFYYRLGNRRRNRDEVEADWVPFTPGDDISVEGRYLQVRAELLPDGTGDVSPQLSELHIYYRPDVPPAPPTMVHARPGDGEILVEWSTVPEPDVAGYLVFYGHRPGEYFAAEANEGSSPVDAGQTQSIRLTGLENGTLYYIAVASYDASGVLQQSRLSREVVARPLGAPP